MKEEAVAEVQSLHRYKKIQRHRTDKGFPTAYCWKHCDSTARFLLNRLLIQPEEDAGMSHLLHSTYCSLNQQKNWL